MTTTREKPAPRAHDTQPGDLWHTCANPGHRYEGDPPCIPGVCRFLCGRAKTTPRREDRIGPPSLDTCVVCDTLLEAELDL